VSGFSARPRRPDDDDGKTQRLVAEVERLISRMERAARDGRDEFLAADSDGRDIGALALINLADLVHRDLPAEIVSQLPAQDVAGLRATRNIAAHNYAALDNDRLWATITVHAPALLTAIRSALLER
jgi:hypothetical protein